MILKISRGMWFISILGVLASLLLVYPGLPEMVLLAEDGPAYIQVGREAFFYGVLAIVTVTNAFVFVIGAIFSKEEGFRSWFNGLIIVLNVFFIISLFFLNAVNSLEKFDFSRIGFLIYGSVILIILWSLSWPAYALGRKIFGSRGE